MNSQKLDWDDLKIALAIGRAGSLSGAARRLGVNHATVFRRLKAMEEKIGVRLFEKLPDGYAPTPAGEEAIAVAGGFEEGVTALERRIVGRDLAPSGTVRLTTVSELLIDILPPMIASFHRRHPGIRLDVIADPGQANLSRRDADVAIRFTSTPPETLVGRRIALAKAAVYASTRYLEERGPIGALADERWIGFDDSLAHLGSARWLDALLAGRQPVAGSNVMLGVRQLVAAGLGLGILPCLEGDTVPGLVRVKEPEPDWHTEVWLLTHPDLRQTARVRAVMDHFGEELTKLRPRFEGRREGA